MSSRIFLQRSDGSLVDMAARPFVSEDVLQKLLAEYPSLLAGDEINPQEPRKWILVSREMGVPSAESEGSRWSLDHLFIDQEGIPTLVEVKRSSNTEIRRDVVGQMLDYAANAVVYWPLEQLRARFEEACRQTGADPADAIVEVAREEADPDEFWQDVKTNLRAGRVRLVFVADEIPTELQRIVEFLNEQMDPAEVIAIQVKQYVSADEGVRTLVPQVIGRTAAAVQAKRAGRRSEQVWTEPKLREAFSQLDTPRARDTMLKLLDWTLDRDLFMTAERGTPGFGVMGPMGTRILTFSSDGMPWCYLGDEKFEDRTHKRDSLLRLLQELGMLDSDYGPQDVSSRGLRRELWELDNEELDRLLATIEEAVGTSTGTATGHNDTSRR